MVRIALAVLAFSLLASARSTYYVAPNGSDSTGNGSATNPWATLAKAVSAIPDDGSTVLLRDGVYARQVIISRKFTHLTTFRSERPYGAKLRNSGALVLMLYYVKNVEIAGFDIAQSNPSTTGPLAVKIAGGGNLILRNNIIHESYNNDLLKINEGARNVLVTGNVFRNQQGGSGQHIDVNGCVDVTIRENIFFNDAAAARISSTAINQTHGFIVIKNSSMLPESRRTRVQNNVFLNFQGGSGSNFVLIGEDGLPIYEAEDILIENNLMLGNSSTKMRAPFGVKGGRNIVFRNNTVAGDLPSAAYALRFNREGSNPVNRDIQLVNNIWSDPTGTMVPISDGAPSESTNVLLNNNLYWNGGNPIPVDSDVLNAFMDVRGLTANPQLPSQGSITLPNWSGTQFASGSKTIRAEFERLVRTYGRPASGSPVIGRSDPTNSPEGDILDTPRNSAPDLGAVQTMGTSAGVRVALFQSGVQGGATLALNRVSVPHSNGATVLLSSSNPAIASVPTSATIPAGDDSVTFPISTTAVNGVESVTITATADSAVRSATLTVSSNGVSVAALSSITMSTSSVIGGTVVSARVSLSAPAPSSGAVVALRSSLTTAATLPGTVTIPAGATSATMNVQTASVTSLATVALTATYANISKTAALEVKPAELTSATGITASVYVRSTATGGGKVPFAVFLSTPAPANGLTVAVRTSRTDLIAVPAAVTVPAGSTRVDSSFSTTAVATSQAASISVTAGGVTRSGSITIIPPCVSSIYFATSATSGTKVPIAISLLGPAPAGGFSVRLTSNSTLISVPSSVTVPAGATRIDSSFAVGTVSSQQSVSISASGGGVTKTRQITVTP